MITRESTPFENKIWAQLPHYAGEELKYMTEAFETNWLSTVGENINAAKRLLAEKIGCKYSAALTCGTVARHLTMKLADIKRGDCVFVPI